MHPEIRKFPSSEFYSNKLRDALRITTEVEQFNSGTLGDDKKRRVVADFIQINSKLHLNPVMFFNLNSREEIHGKSFRNPTECNFLFSFLSFLSPVLLGFTVGIITPYKSQVDAIRREISNLKQRNPSASSTTSSSSNFWRELLIDVNTVDGYQGKEKDIIILSTVRTRSIGFLTDQRRLNVAITRAKRCLVIIGSQRLLCEDPVWNHMITDLQERQYVFNVTSDDFRNFSGYHDLEVGIHGKTSKVAAVRTIKESTTVAQDTTVRADVGTVNPQSRRPADDRQRMRGTGSTGSGRHNQPEEGEVFEAGDPIGKHQPPSYPRGESRVREISGVMKRVEKRRGELLEGSAEKRLKRRAGADL